MTCFIYKNLMYSMCADDREDFDLVLDLRVRGYRRKLSYKKLIKRRKDFFLSTLKYK